MRASAARSVQRCRRYTGRVPEPRKAGPRKSDWRAALHEVPEAWSVPGGHDGSFGDGDVPGRSLLPFALKATWLIHAHGAPGRNVIPQAS